MAATSQSTTLSSAVLVEPNVTPIDQSQIIAALSYALDITEGQPEGHAARTCIIGMRLALRLDLAVKDRSALYYALLLKDAGCSSNAAKMAYLFGADDRKLKHDLKTIDWPKATESLRFMRQNVAPESSRIERLLKMAAMLLQGPRGARKLVETRCERGAAIARQLGFPEATALAIFHLDEHWNGQGHPSCLRGSEISLLGRIAGLAQTVEVFANKYGPMATREMVAARSGHWFDPELADLFLDVARDDSFWEELRCDHPDRVVLSYAPAEVRYLAGPAELDKIAEAFAQVVDAKSPWTFKHSTGVAHIAIGMGKQFGFHAERLRQLRRTALLHDIGKLGVSNMILDKPGKLTSDEFAAMRRHPEFSARLISRVAGLSDQAEIAGAHHERLDGRGYHRGVASGSLPLEARILMVADVFEALTAARPYRDAIPTEKVLEMLRRDAGTIACPEAFSALEGWLKREETICRVEQQFGAIDRLIDEINNPNCPACNA